MVQINVPPQRVLVHINILPGRVPVQINIPPGNVMVQINPSQLRRMLVQINFHPETRWFKINVSVI